MSVDDKEPFLSRWSRRKLEAKEHAPASASTAAGLPADAPATPLEPAPAPATEPAAQGAPHDVSPAYRQFFDPQVDEKLRHTALRKLFSDPHFKVMDGLDTYIDDYSLPDPIPEAILRQLNQAKALLLFDEEKKTAAGAGNEAAAAASSVEAANTTTPLQAAAAGASAQDAVAATPSAAAPPAEGSRND